MDFRVASTLRCTDLKNVFHCAVDHDLLIKRLEKIQDQIQWALEDDSDKGVFDSSLRTGGRELT